MADHADGLGRDAALAAFKTTFRITAPHKHRYEVFRDFVTMAACSLHNGLYKDQGREEEYLSLINAYPKDDQQRFPELLAHLVNALQKEPRDVLGPLYMGLEIANKDTGQFFSPPELSEMMARLIFAGELRKLENQPFLTAGEPACGAGGMVLALVKVMIEAGHDPMHRLWVQCIDVDRMAALMCYIQLSLWNVPAEVIVGDTLTWDIREVWYTPAHHLGLWSSRLKREQGRGDNTTPPEQVATDVTLKQPTEPKPESSSQEYETHQITWQGQKIIVRWCPVWLNGPSAHLEIQSADPKAHPISQTGYRSHFCDREEIEAAGGPVAFVKAWLTREDDGSPVQLSLF